MLHIRLRRIGKKKQPLYRMIVCEKTKDPWGDYLENLGTFNPRVHPAEVQIKADRIQEWISKGAQCSDTVWNLLIDQGVVKGEKRKTIEISTRRKAKLEKEGVAKKAKDEAKKLADEAKKEAEEAAKKAEAEAKKAAEEAEKLAAEEASKVVAEAPVEAPAEAPAEVVAEAEVPGEVAPAEEKAE